MNNLISLRSLRRRQEETVNRTAFKVGHPKPFAKCIIIDTFEKLLKNMIFKISY